MQRVIVRTKLQAVIVGQLIDDGVIGPRFHLILLSKANEPALAGYCGALIARAATVTRLSRPRLGFLGLFVYFLLLLKKSRARGESVFLANINSYPFALALRFVPNMWITTFDDGAANIQANSMHLRETPSDIPGFRGFLARVLFPVGPSLFVRSRIASHYTIYPGHENIVQNTKLIVTKINWEGLIDPADVERLPKGISRIFLGTVFEEAVRIWKLNINTADLQRLVEWADLYLPHPREPIDFELPAVVAKYPAEALISHYAKRGPLLVAHYNSSAAIPFRDAPNVSLFDLATTDLERLFQSPG